MSNKITGVLLNTCKMGPLSHKYNDFVPSRVLLEDRFCSSLEYNKENEKLGQLPGTEIQDNTVWQLISKLY